MLPILTVPPRLPSGMRRRVGGRFPLLDPDKVRRAMGVGQWREFEGRRTFVYSVPPDAEAAIEILDEILGPMPDDDD